MKERIKQIRKNLKMNQTEFGAAIGATQKMVTTYETGTVVPDKPIRLLICSKFNVNEAWLETGEGDPYVEGLIPTLSHALMRMPSVCAALERILPLMTDDDLDRIDEIADLIRQKFGK
jgi:DNA-binding XRE family transcriptional regulator